MNHIINSSSSHTHLSNASASPQAKRALPDTAITSAATTPQVTATEQTSQTRVAPDLTSITPNDVTRLAAGLLKTGTIDFDQMLRMFVIAANQLTPPGLPGEFINHEPFNLLAVVEHGPHPPPRHEETPLLGILEGLLTAQAVDTHQAVDIQA